MNQFICKKCGECCRQLVICLTYSDIMRWVKQNRQDILRETVFAKGAPQGDGFYFEHTITAPKKPCLFLKENRCSIHKTKPACCKAVPDSLNKFDICPVWKKDKHFSKKRFEKINRSLDKDFKACVINFKQFLEITFMARGFGHLKPKVN